MARSPFGITNLLLLLICINAVRPSSSTGYDEEDFDDDADVATGYDTAEDVDTASTDDEEGVDSSTMKGTDEDGDDTIESRDDEENADATIEDNGDEDETRSQDEEENEENMVLVQRDPVKVIILFIFFLSFNSNVTFLIFE